MAEASKKKGGRGHWVALRVSAVGLLGLTVWAVWFMAQAIGADHAAFTELLARPWNAAAMIALIVLATVHMTLGVHEIVEDYIHHPALKRAKRIAGDAALSLVALACIGAVLVIALT